MERASDDTIFENKNKAEAATKPDGEAATKPDGEAATKPDGEAATKPDDEEIHLEPVTSFEEMGLKAELFRGILAYGFETPSIIQQQAIPAFVQHNRDIIAQAQSGTGKTATFSVALLQKIKEEDDALQGIILAPTRELASQIHGVISALGQFTKARISLVSGGGGVRDSIRQLQRDRPHVVVATPGRICHFIRDRYINTRNVRYIIMDEADELLSDGFADQVREIISQLPEELQIGLYTATITEEMNDIVKQFMRNPIEVRVKREELTLEGIRQYKVSLDQEHWKFGVLKDLYSSISIYQMMIYCNSKRNVEFLKRQMDEENIPCEAIHGELSTDERSNIMHRFRAGDVRVLVTTDLLCRGIDVQQVSLVINYDLPRDVAPYLHRIGRGGRFGRKGYAINLVVDDPNGGYDRRGGNDREQLKRLEQYYETQIDDLPDDLTNVFV
jgi:translation initiation factor 4A